MTIEEKIQAVLIAYAPLTALVPANRIKTQADQQGIARPYIMHGPIGVEPTHTHSGLAALRHWPFYTISVVTTTQPTARQIAEVVKSLLGNYTGSTFKSMWQSEGPYVIDSSIPAIELPIEFDVWEGVND